MNKLDKYCALLFDEMSISTNLKYNTSLDEVVGYVDLGSLGRSHEYANHALVFMIQGLYKRWKQPIAYYFTKDVVKTKTLKILIVEIISALQNCGLIVVCTICDQGSTNQAAIKQLTCNSVGTFQINDQTVTPIFDVPHLLKNTRNTLFNYNIIFDNNKVAKFSHIVDCYNIDKSKRCS